MSSKEKQRLAQRMEFVLAVERNRAEAVPESAFGQLCKQAKISRQTGYRWLTRWKQGGLNALVDTSRRPRSSPRQTPAEIERRIVAMRLERPDWGARKFARLLADDGVEMLPQTIHRVLRRNGLVLRPTIMPSAGERFERSRSNELWQMDFKGPMGPLDGAMPLSILDDHSRYLVSLTTMQSTKAGPVREALEATFRRHGVPQAMLMDHGTPWWNSHGTGWTQLTVWLMKQGVRIHLSGIRHPQTQGKVERFHRTLKIAAELRGGPLKRSERQAWLDAFRLEYNEVRPHEALGMETPSRRWRPSEKAYEARPAEWDYGPKAEVRRLDSGGQLNVDNRRWGVSRALANERVRLDRIDERMVVTYRNTTVRAFDLKTGEASYLRLDLRRLLQGNGLDEDPE